MHDARSYRIAGQRSSVADVSAMGRRTLPAMVSAEIVDEPPMGSARVVTADR